VADSIGERVGAHTGDRSLVYPNGHVRPAPPAGRRRMRVWGTPGKIWLLTSLFLVATSVLVLSTRTEMDGSRQTFEVIGAHSEPNVTHAQDLYFVLAAMDADAADYMLVDSDPAPQQRSAACRSRASRSSGRSPTARRRRAG
jgi:hypothetical protein